MNFLSLISVEQEFARACLYENVACKYLFIVIDLQAAVLAAVICRFQESNNSTRANLTQLTRSFSKHKALHVALFEICRQPSSLACQVGDN